MTGGARARHVVLLEDDDLDAELVTERLRADGVHFEVRRAADEATYLALLEEGGAALVLSDFSLPSYGGVAALDAAQHLAPGVPFIFVSGAIGEELAIETLRRGATDYVLKHRLERLGPAVQRALAEAEALRLRAAAERERDLLLASERHARASAEDANRMKDEFLAVVSHELRTPLNAILGWASLLAGGRSDEATRARGLDAIVRNARLQGRLIEDILDISRIVSGKLHLQLAPVRLDSFVTAALDSIRPAAAAKNIQLDVGLDPGGGEIFADGERLQQVVWNLVANAVKFTPAGGSVSVRGSRRPASMTVEVADTGSGIDAALLPHVFERFRQADGSKTRAHGGLGLGLAIVKSLVEMHGGEVSVRSAGLGCGATFVVDLPLRSDATPTSPPSPPPPCRTHPDSARTSVAERDLTGVRVLVVDDEPDARELVEEVLRGRGAEVTTHASVDAALRAVRAFRPDVVVSDIGMPDADGYALVRRLRALPAHEGGAVPAIALTAYARELDRREAESAGYQRHLAKPIAPHLLIAAIDEVLRSAPPVERSPHGCAPSKPD